MHCLGQRFQGRAYGTEPTCQGTARQVYTATLVYRLLTVECQVVETFGIHQQTRPRQTLFNQLYQ
ncbi:hypothetical protein D3C81_2234500 [compost metagenome]